MRVMGIDPGLQKVGVGVLDVDGRKVVPVFFETIKTKRSRERFDRMHDIYEQLTRVIEEYQPDALALEDVFYGANVKVAIRLGEARALAILAARQAGVPVCEYLPTRVKESICGNGRAAKTQMQHMIKRLLNIVELPEEDAADALAIALCHIHTKRIR